jgi:hypothetical protein
MMMSLLPPSSFQLCCILTHCHHSLFASWLEKVLSTLVRAGDQVPKGLAATIFATKKGKKELNAIAENLENYFEVYHYNRQLGDDKKRISCQSSLLGMFAIAPPNKWRAGQPRGPQLVDQQKAKRNSCDSRESNSGISRSPYAISDRDRAICARRTTDHRRQDNETTARRRHWSNTTPPDTTIVDDDDNNNNNT